MTGSQINSLMNSNWGRQTSDLNGAWVQQKLYFHFGSKKLCTGYQCVCVCVFGKEANCVWKGG